MWYCLFLYKTFKCTIQVIINFVHSNFIYFFKFHLRWCQGIISPNIKFLWSGTIFFVCVNLTFILQYIIYITSPCITLRGQQMFSGGGDSPSSQWDVAWGVILGTPHHKCSGWARRYRTGREGYMRWWGCLTSTCRKLLWDYIIRSNRSGTSCSAPPRDWGIILVPWRRPSSRSYSWTSSLEQRSTRPTRQPLYFR